LYFNLTLIVFFCQILYFVIELTYMKILAINKRASFNYHLLDRYEAGLVLSGAEVKSIKTGHISVKESFITRKGREFFLTNAHIPPYPFAGKISDYNPTRPRKILLRRSEIKSLIGKMTVSGLTLVPLRVYTKKRPHSSARSENMPSRKSSATREPGIIRKKNSDIGGLIKLEFALAKGKKKFDKRSDIAKKETQRKIERTLKNF